MATLRRTTNGYLYFNIPIACLVCRTVALKCLQCMDPAPNGPCRHDFMTQVNTSLGIFPNNYNIRPYCKDCNDGVGNAFQNNCVMEEFYSSGLIKSFNRDCSDGVSFSFSEKLSSNSKLTQIAPDNFTTCVYDLGTHYHICLTLCSGDFCNAPRKPPENKTCVDQ